MSLCATLQSICTAEGICMIGLENSLEIKKLIYLSCSGLERQKVLAVW